MVVNPRESLTKAAMFLGAVASLMLAPPTLADEKAPFRFESVSSLDAMHSFIKASFPLGVPQASLQKLFVEEGRGSYRKHPTLPNTEKYLYDINLCRVYVWRWNISADFDDGGRLSQAYVNGEPVHLAGTQTPNAKASTKGGTNSIFKVKRLRPEADKGESELVYLLLDGDGDTKTTDDQFLMGAGPTRPDPANMGTVHVYKDVELWRSIFDPDAADIINQYSGECKSDSKGR